MLRFSSQSRGRKHGPGLLSGGPTGHPTRRRRGGRGPPRGHSRAQLQDDEQRSALERAESQLAKSRREYERQQKLFERELISEQAWNDAVYDLEQLEIAVADARRDLGYTEVRAPISGVVTRRLVKLGDNVTVNQHLFDLVDFDSLVARLYVPERELERLRIGQSVRIQSESWGSREPGGDGHPHRTDRRSSHGHHQGDGQCAAHTEGVVPGMFVEAELVTAVHEDALLVPKRTLVFDGDQSFVFRMKEDQRVERLLLRPVLEDNEHVEPDDSLSEGDRLVVAGQAGLKDGALVRVVGGES